MIKELVLVLQIRNELKSLILSGLMTMKYLIILVSFASICFMILNIHIGIPEGYGWLNEFINISLWNNILFFFIILVCAYILIDRLNRKMNYKRTIYYILRKIENLSIICILFLALFVAKAILFFEYESIDIVFKIVFLSSIFLVWLTCLSLLFEWTEDIFSNWKRFEENSLKRKNYFDLLSAKLKSDTTEDLQRHLLQLQILDLEQKLYDKRIK